MVYNKQQLLGEEWKNKTNAYVPKDAKKKKSGGGPFSLVSKASQSSDYHIKMLSFTAEIIMFTAWYKQFCSP